jgi:hypothetical protein
MGSHRQKPGKETCEPTALSAEDLTAREPLVSNGISAYRIGTIERMEHFTPPMELDAIADALGIARGYFRPEDGLPAIPLTGEASPSEVADLLRRQSRVLDRIEQAIVTEEETAARLTADGEAWADRVIERAQAELRAAPETQEPGSKAPAKSASQQG